MSTTSFVVHPAIDHLPREACRVVFQTVLADFDLMKIIMEFYEFYSNNVTVFLLSCITLVTLTRSTFPSTVQLVHLFLLFLV